VACDGFEARPGIALEGAYGIAAVGTFWGGQLRYILDEGGVGLGAGIVLVIGARALRGPSALPCDNPVVHGTLASSGFRPCEGTVTAFHRRDQIKGQSTAR
jgi:hypothetical protein